MRAEKGLNTTETVVNLREILVNAAGLLLVGAYIQLGIGLYSVSVRNGVS